MFINKNRIIPTAVLFGACIAFAGGSTAFAASATSAGAAGAGPVVVTCNGLVITDRVPAGGAVFVPVNPNGNNVILGTAGRDVIFAGPGNDTLCTLGGNDENWGEGGADTFFSGTGEDRNLGGGDDDRFDCGPDQDVANGGSEFAGDLALVNCESQFDIP